MPNSSDIPIPGAPLNSRTRKRRPIPRHLPGHIAGRYRVLSMLGRGATGIVVEAYDLLDDRLVALKLLKRECARDAKVLQRFIQEARAMGKLDHPGVVKVFEHGVDKSGLHFLVMDIVNGLSVAEYIEDRRRSPRRDVLTDLATTTYPDGSVPEVVSVVRSATFLFAAGQETTARLLATALKHLAEHSELQEILRERKDLIGNFIEEALRMESPVKTDFRLARRTARVAARPRRNRGKIRPRWRTTACARGRTARRGARTGARARTRRIGRRPRGRTSS